MEFARGALIAQTNPEKAHGMQAYMKTDMPFYGGNVIDDLVKTGIKGLAFRLAEEPAAITHAHVRASARRLGDKAALVKALVSVRATISLPPTMTAAISGPSSRRSEMPSRLGMHLPPSPGAPALPVGGTRGPAPARR